MNAFAKAVLASVWTGALILTVVIAVDGQEQARHEHQVRDDTRVQLDIVRASLGDAIERRSALSERLAAFVDASPDADEERFSQYAASLAASQPGVRSLRLVSLEGHMFVYPETADTAPLEALGATTPSTDPRIAGPFSLPSGSKALAIATPVHQSDGLGRSVWGVALVEFYLDPMLGEAKLVGWPGDARFALRGTDGHGESGSAFFGNSDIFTSEPVTTLISFPGGQWQLAAVPVEGWPEESPATWWIRLGGGVLALFASVLVGVLVSEPARLRTAVESATRSAQENEERFRSVSDSAQDAIVTVDETATITYANRAAESLYGYRLDELLGSAIEDLLPTEARLLEQGGADKSSMGGSTEVLSARRDGKRVPVELSTAGWTVGGRQYRTAIIRDITERKRVQEDQARLAAVLDTTPDLVAIADPHGRLEYVNHAAREVLGLADDRSGERALIDLYPEQIRRGFWEEAVPSALRHGAWRGESTLLAADGRRIPVSQVLLTHHDQDGHLTAIALLARDMTEERRAEDELKREKERFRTLSEAAFEGIIVYEAGKIIEVNSAFAQMVGRPTHELVGMDMLDLVAPESRSEAQDRLRHPREGAYEIAVLHDDGRVFPVEVATKHFPYRDRVVRVLAARDITERKKAEVAQRVALERLSEIERLKEIDQFKTHLLNTASHELNTPITPIRLQLHLLKNAHLGDLSDRHRKAIDVLDRNVERLALLVQDVLDVARLQSGRLKIHQEPLDVDTLVREAVEAFEEPAKLTDVGLHVEGHGNLWVVGDGHRLTQVLFNYISNALKFTPPHGRVKIEMREEAGRALIRVIDTGHGLTEDQMKRLFKPFSQVHDTMQSTRSGTGLGLYISKGIIEEHEGTVWCDSDGPGKGATFGFSLPIATSIELDSSNPEERTRRLTSADR